jgi:hypothetical protein
MSPRSANRLSKVVRTTATCRYRRENADDSIARRKMGSMKWRAWLFEKVVSSQAALRLPLHDVHPVDPV